MSDSISRYKWRWLGQIARYDFLRGMNPNPAEEVDVDNEEEVKRLIREFYLPEMRDSDKWDVWKSAILAELLDLRNRRSLVPDEDLVYFIEMQEEVIMSAGNDPASYYLWFLDVLIDEEFPELRGSV